MLALCPPVRGAPCCVWDPPHLLLHLFTGAGARTAAPPAVLPGRDPVPPAGPLGGTPQFSLCRVPRVQPSSQGLCVALDSG